MELEGRGLAKRIFLAWSQEVGWRGEPWSSALTGQWRGSAERQGRAYRRWKAVDNKWWLEGAVLSIWRVGWGQKGCVCELLPAPRLGTLS